MKIDKKKTIIFELLLLTFLLICAFFSFKYVTIVLAIIASISAMVASFLLRKKQNYFTNVKQVTLVLIAFSIIYLALFYTLGIYTGYYKNSTPLSFDNLFRFVIPTMVTIIATEIIRDRVLSINYNVSRSFLFVISVLIDINMFGYIYDITKLNDFLIILGFITFASILSNVLYFYLNPKFGPKPIIAYRLITTMYVYLFPIIPNVYVFFRTFFRMIYPLFIYIYIENYYNPDKVTKRRKEKRMDNFSLASTFVVLTFLICLISCKFMYGVLVIGSGSMTGSLNKGDLVLFKNTKNDLEVGDIIVFKKDNLMVVHRIVRIDDNDGVYQYHTKGDANQIEDDGYVIKEDIMGKVKVRVKKIGKPTLWLRDQFR